MVATPPISRPPLQSLDDWMQNPPDHTEWVDGELIEKKDMTLKHSQVQAKIARLWGNFKEERQLGGAVYTEAPCRTNNQGRSPDVAYLPADLFAQYRHAKVLPQSFPLSAEIISPTDLAGDVIAKAQEYLQSGGEEIWLVLPESRWVIVATQTSQQIFEPGDVATMQGALLGFRVAVAEFVG